MTELYRKKKAQPMMPYNPEVGMPKCVSISDADKAKGSPKLGDMIAINPNDINDMWLVAKEFFEENYEKIPSENKKVNHKNIDDGTMNIQTAKKYLKCDNCGKLHQDTPDFVMCDCGRVAIRMEWVTHEKEIEIAKSKANLQNQNQEHIEN